MDDLNDKRFAHIATDLRFKGVPRQERRIKIDKRFQSMFNDKSFKLKSSVDKRGRPQTSYTATEDLKKYYHLSSSSSSSEADDDDEEEEIRPSTPTPRSGRRNPVKLSEDKNDDQVSESDDNEDSDEEEKEPAVDYARGHGNIETSSSEDDDNDDDDSEEDKDEVEMIHPWGELDENADRTTDTATKRLAVCNMNWDQIKAQDIHVLLSSFVPPGGVILSIKIYLSDFGRERLSKEDVDGPEELVTFGGGKALPDGDDKHQHREQVRLYHLNRLRYYYAVVECDSAQTAGALYDGCDGLEYESSATRLDLRFIPDDMQFDEAPHSVMETSVDVGRYRPQIFTTTALQHCNVKLSWDDTTADRIQVFRRAFDNNDEEDDDLKAYLASSSSSSDENDDDNDNENDKDGAKMRNSDGEQGDAGDKEEDRIAKYKALLSGIDNEEEMVEDGDVQMEITWGPGLREQAESIVKKKLLEKEEKAADKQSSWERYLERRKEKRQRNLKEKLNKSKNAKNEGSTKEASNEADNPYSDDELPDDVNLDDPFFKIDDDDEHDLPKNKKAVSVSKPKKYGKKQVSSNSDNELDERQKANLELLMMDEDDHKNHFSLKKLLKSDNKSTRKLKKAKPQQQVSVDAVSDDFEMNVNDSRFSAVYSSHLFNIDPSEPHFKKTGGMAAMVGEKQRRLATGITTPTWKPKRAKLDTSLDKKTVDAKRTELSLLVKSVKSKATSFMTKKHDKKRSSNNR